MNTNGHQWEDGLRHRAAHVAGKMEALQGWRGVWLLWLMLGAVASAGPWYDANTGRIERERPTSLNWEGGFVMNPTEETLRAVGWFPLVRCEAAAPGYRVTSRTVEVGATQAVEVCTVEAVPARVPPAPLIQNAAIYRLLLRQHFGDGAETNRAVTAAAVSGYFMQRRLTGQGAATDGLDAVFLNEVFRELSDWTGDGTAWSFPWEVVP